MAYYQKSFCILSQAPRIVRDKKIKFAMPDDGAKALSVDEKIARKDIAELVAEAL